jgi:hypothetical protein
LWASLFVLIDGDLCENLRLLLDEREEILAACAGSVALRSEVDLPILPLFS